MTARKDDIPMTVLGLPVEPIDWNKIGRPTKYRPEMCKQIEELMKDGKSITSAAYEMGLSKTTVFRWAQENPEFRDALDRARLSSQAWWEEKGHNSLDKSCFQSNLWNFNMKNRFKTDWKDKQEVEVDTGEKLEGLLSTILESTMGPPSERGK